MQVTVYIRQDNVDKWLALDNKSEWINDMLAGDEPSLERKIRRIALEVVQEQSQQYH